MNTDKLKEIVDRIYDAESKITTQAKLQQLVAALQNVVNQPQNVDHQNALAQKQREFSSSLEAFEHAFSPRDYQRVQELSEDAFDPGMSKRISSAISENSMSPSVVLEMTQKLQAMRNEVLTKLNELRNSMDYFDFGYLEAEVGTTDVGFQIPRELFNNNLEGLIKELREIRLMIQYFSEATVGEYHPATVGSISTTDPLIFLTMSAPIAKYFAGAVTWGLGVWYSVEKIRNIRAQTAQLQSFTPEEVEEIFDSKIKKEIEVAVENKVTEILNEGAAPKARHGELKSQLTWVLNSLLAKMERGLTIELRLSPPPVEGADGEEQAQDTAGSLHQELSQLQEELVFPKPSGNPVLEIPEAKNGEEKGN